MKKVFSRILILIVFGVFSVTAMGASKILVTSFGQSADAAMLKVLLKKSKVEYSYNSLAMPEDIAGYDVVAIAAGASSKGMGAAGINPIDELKRAKALVKEANGKDIEVVTFHLGGAGRRGKLSDQYIKVAAENSEKVVVVKGGNDDNLFTDITNKNNIELIEVPNIIGVMEPIKTIF